MRVVGCRKRPPQAPSSRLWEIDDTLSKICQDLSNCRRHTHLHMKQKHVRLSGQLTIRRGHPKTVERKKKSANMVVAPGLHQRILRCGGLVWWGDVNLRGCLWLIVDPHLSWIWIKTRMFQTGSVDRARSGGCQSGSRLCLRRQSDDEAAAWPTMEKSCSSQSVLSRNSYLIRNIYTVALQIFYLTIFICDNNCIFYKV